MDRVVVITGASRGIGRATALALTKAGFHIALGYAQNESAARDAAQAIAAQGGKASPVRCDVGSESEIVAAFARADALGRLCGLVNNAGVVDVPARVDEMSLERLERMWRINITGSFLCAREAVKRMSTRHGGQGGAIVNVSSAVSRLGAPGVYVDYAASKGAIDTFTLGLAREVADEGIRVNAVRPGIIATDIHASSGTPDRPAQMVGLIPMKRIGEAEEVAQSIAWLMSDQASYVTGALVDVSGGR